MASSHSAVRKALRGLEDGLSVFTQQLAAEAAELRRNVDSRPRTGATYYRNILEDLQQRADGLGQELAALEAVSTEAVSLEVGAGGRAEQQAPGRHCCRLRPPARCNNALTTVPTHRAVCLAGPSCLLRYEGQANQA